MILQPAVNVMEAAVLDIGESVTQKAEAVVSYRDVNEPIFKKNALTTKHYPPFFVHVFSQQICFSFFCIAFTTLHLNS